MTTLYVDNIAPNLQSKISAPNLTLPSGSVVQVQYAQAQDASEITTSSNSLVASGIQVRITPTSTSSKILVHFNTSMQDHNSSSNIRGQMYVDGSAWGSSGQYQLGYGDSNNRYGPWSWYGVYSPSDTSEILFEPYFRGGTAASCKLVHNQASYTLYAMEIAG